MMRTDKKNTEMFPLKRIPIKAAAKRKMAKALLLTMILAACVPYTKQSAYAADSLGTVYMRSAQDLLNLADKCHEDSYSRGMNVVVSEDIDLTGSGFTGIPVFNGIFDGRGHTISGYTYGGDGFVSGFFRYVGSEGVIANVKLDVSIVAGDKQKCTGALAGINQGIIRDCSVLGTVSGYEETGAICGINQEGGYLLRCRNKGRVMGYYYTGGITGKNFGLVSCCVNEGHINDTTKWIQNDDEMNADFMSNFTVTEPKDTISLQSGVDTGGICGYSQGTIISCTNEGNVGYAHAGYNIGGIVGRQCGFTSSCANKGNVYGKKDVGGICGQSEPYIETDPGRSMRGSAEKLNAKIDRALKDAGDASNEVIEELKTLQQYSQKALDTTSSMTDQASAYVDEQVDKANKVIETVSENDITTKEGYDKTKKEAEDALKKLEKQAEQDGKDLIKQGKVDEKKLEDEAKKEKEKAEKTAKDVKDKPYEYIKKADDAWKEKSGQLKSNLQGASDTMDRLNNTASAYSEELQADIKAIEDQVNSMNQMVTDLIDGVAEEGLEYVFADISEDALEYTGTGIINSCANKGIVRGDNDAGGIIGAMDIDRDNLENNVALTFSLKAGESYTLSVICSDCTNDGFVYGRGDNAGGITGYMHFGMIRNSYGYGLVESDGSCVGGIAGESSGCVKDCYVLCSLAGSSNIGGITGSGEKIKNCISMPVFQKVSGTCGAIAGQVNRDKNSRAMNTDEVYENYYVADEIYGIDDISYEKVAQTITYKELLEKEDLPDPYRHLTVTFRIENKRLGKQEMAYGSSMDRLNYPKVPEKEGYYVRWEDVSGRKVNGNLVVSAEYVPLIPVIESNQHTEDQKAYGYMDGGFDDQVRLTVTPKDELTDEETSAVQSFGTYKNRIGYQVKVTGISSDSLGEKDAKIRLYCPYHKKLLLLKQNQETGTFESVAFTQKGSYLEADLSGTQETYLIAAGAELSLSQMLLLIGGIALLVALLLTIRGIKGQVRGKKDAQKEQTC